MTATNSGSQADTPLIELTGLGKTFGSQPQATEVLKDINLSIDRGDFVTIQGPSGSGKSTLLSILSLLDQASSGQYRLEGNDVTRLDFDTRAVLRNRFLGVVFQAFQLLGDMTARENVTLPLRYSAHIPKAEWRERVAAALERVGLADRADFYPAQLSGGQQQRVAIARALVTEPAIIFADEPTGNLDSRNAAAIMQLFSELNQQGVTVCMVTHDPQCAAVGRRAFHIKDGRLREEPA
jgi:putative ABC transport system ATP-binding protein